MSHPLAEVFGFPIVNDSEHAKRFQANRLCPFNNIGPNCTKNSIEDPLGVCTMFHQGKPIIICPIRFRQDWLMIGLAAEFFFPPNSNWTSLGEVRLKDKSGNAVGNIDYVLVAYDAFGRVTDFASLEVQAVYISGNLSGPFKSYLYSPSPSFEWKGAMYYPAPDFLSSSKKRLVPQLISKGSILNFWGKKQAVAIQTDFFKTLPSLREVSKEEADLAWFLFDLSLDQERLTYNLFLSKVVYTRYEACLDILVTTDPGEEQDFIALLQRKLDQKLAKEENTEIFEP